MELERKRRESWKEAELGCGGRRREKDAEDISRIIRRRMKLCRAFIVKKALKLSKRNLGLVSPCKV